MLPINKAAPGSHREIGSNATTLPVISITLAAAQSIYAPELRMHSIPLAALAERLKRPAVRKQKDGPGIVLADMSAPYRKNANVRAVTALAYDLEASPMPPPPPAVLHERCNALGWWHVIVSTYSHAPEAPRYRLLLALTRPIAPDLYRSVWPLPLEALGLPQCVDAACRDPARLYLLPACPPSHAHHFQHHHGTGNPLNSETLAAIWAAREIRKPKPAPNVRIANRGESVIGQFNASHSIADLLGAHGYTQRGKRWSKPGTSHGAGVMLLNDGRLYSHHAGDPLAGRACDAFDVFATLEHGGDVRAAVRALRGAA